MRDRLFHLCSWFVALALVLAACAQQPVFEVVKTAQTVKATTSPRVSNPAADFKSSDPSRVINVVTGEPETLDPGLNYEAAGAEFIQNIYETLITYNREKPANFVPQLAVEMPAISADGKTYIFKIRQGVKFHDGQDMTPSDVAYSFQRGLLQGGTASPQYLLTEPFFGKNKYLGSTVDDISVVVMDKILDRVVASAQKSAENLDFTRLTTTTVKTYISSVAAEYALSSGNGAGLSTNPANELLAQVKQTSGLAAQRQALVNGALAAVMGLDSSDMDAVYQAYYDTLYDDTGAMQKVNREIRESTAAQVKDLIVADDSAWTVTFHLAQPWGPFLATLANSWGSVMSKAWVTANGGWDGENLTWAASYAMKSENDPFTSITNGTGAYKLDHWTKGQELVMVRNDAYWRKEPAWPGGPVGPAAVERVITRYVNEWSTRLAMFQAGEADFLLVPPANYSQIDPLVGESCNFNVRKDTFDPCVTTSDQQARLYKGAQQASRTDIFLNFNIADPDGSNHLLGSGKLDGEGIPPDFFSDIHVRRAINYCFDWDTYIKDALNGEAVQSIGILLPGMPGYDLAGAKYTLDQAKCEQEFKASTLKSADGRSLWDVGFRMQVGYSTSNDSAQIIAQILASNVAQVNPKFQIEIVGMPWATFLRQTRDMTLPMFISGWQEDFHDPHNWFMPYLLTTYGSLQNMPASLTDQFKQLIDQGVAEADPAARALIYSRLNQLVYEQAPDVILAVPTARHYEQRWMQGYYYNPILSGYYYYAISKK